MLKIVKASIAFAVTSLLVTAPAQATVNEALQNICSIIKADDKGHAYSNYTTNDKEMMLELL